MTPQILTKISFFKIIISGCRHSEFLKILITEIENEINEKLNVISKSMPFYVKYATTKLLYNCI